MESVWWKKLGKERWNQKKRLWNQSPCQSSIFEMDIKKKKRKREGKGKEKDKEKEKKKKNEKKKKKKKK